MALLNCYLFSSIFSYNIIEFKIIAKRYENLRCKIKTNIKMNDKNIKKFLKTKIEILIPPELKKKFRNNYAKVTENFYDRITILKENNINFNIGMNIMKYMIDNIINECKNIENLGHLDKKQIEYYNYIKHINFIPYYIISPMRIIDSTLYVYESELFKNYM
jgi:hypothetical protein